MRLDALRIETLFETAMTPSTGSAKGSSADLSSGAGTGESCFVLLRSVLAIAC